MIVKVGVSARHIHLNENDFNALFGEETSLTKFKDINQNQFASNETLIVKTDKGQFNNVRVIGPLRNYTQVEISKTDAYTLGINPPVRSSGDLENSETVTLMGPKGEKIAYNSCIIATRHVHASREDLKKHGLNKDDILKVKVNGKKAGIMENIVIKVDDNFDFELHIDLDDANAHLINQGDSLEMEKDK